VRSATVKTSHSWAQLARQEKLPQDVWYHYSSMTKLPQSMLHFKLVDEQRTWVTPYQKVQLSRSPPWHQMMHLRSEHGKKSWSEDLKHWTLTRR
jgi:hypothetical protein